MGQPNLTLSDISRVAHDAVRALQLALADPDPQLSWDKAPTWSRDETRARVAADLAGVTNAAWHESWCADRRANGWLWGQEYDVVTRTDPRIVPYSRVHPDLLAADAVRAAVVDALAEYLA